jgi:hypothetical protein
MTASNRLLDIEEKFGTTVDRIVPIELDESTIKVILYMKDGSNLRVVELWENRKLKRYSYYWLTAKNELIIGWDNAPHHTQFDTFPHHKHIKLQSNLQPSIENSLEKVMEYIEPIN